MKISDLIAYLEKMKAQEGDLTLRHVEICPHQQFYKNEKGFIPFIPRWGWAKLEKFSD